MNVVPNLGWGRLVYEGGNDNTNNLPQEVLLRLEEVVIGREARPNVHVVFHAPYISSRHLKIGRRPTGEDDDIEGYYVLDLSRNGTFIMDAGTNTPERCVPNVLRPIHFGDKIVFTFKSEVKAVYMVRYVSAPPPPPH